MILTPGGLLSTAGDMGGILWTHIERNDRIKSNAHKKSLAHSADTDIKYLIIFYDNVHTDRKGQHNELGASISFQFPMFEN